MTHPLYNVREKSYIIIVSYISTEYVTSTTLIFVQILILYESLVIKTKKHHIVGTIPKLNIKIIKKAKSVLIIHKYMKLFTLLSVSVFHLMFKINKKIFLLLLI